LTEMLPGNFPVRVLLIIFDARAH